MEEASQAPNIDRKTVRVTLENLWRCVPLRTDFEFDFLVGLAQFDSAAKISNPYISILCQVRREDVLNLNIAMNDVSLVHALDTTCNLSYNFSCVLFRKGLNLLMHQVVQQVATWHELRHNVQVMSVLKVLDQG